MKYQVITKSLDDTKNLASVLAKTLNPPYLIFLKGDLGAGKTTFTRFLIESLGVLEPVTSPTFTLLNEYDGKFKIYHFDMYRLSSADEAVELGFDEIFSENAIFLVEWPENVAGLNLKPDMVISISSLGDSERRVTVEF